MIFCLAAFGRYKLRLCSLSYRNAPTGTFWLEREKSERAFPVVRLGFIGATGDMRDSYGVDSPNESLKVVLEKRMTWSIGTDTQRP
jgi:hypothetical protein